MIEQRVEFETVVAVSGNNTGIEVPPEAIEALGAGSRPPVEVDLAGYVYRSTVGVMGGRHLVPVSAAVRAASGVRGGDTVRVRLTHAPQPREIAVPDDLDAALEESGTRAFFEGLANSLQRYHVDQVTSAKAPETRARRVAKAVDLFAAGRKR